MIHSTLFWEKRRSVSNRAKQVTFVIALFWAAFVVSSPSLAEQNADGLKTISVDGKLFKLTAGYHSSSGGANGADSICATRPQSAMPGLATYQAKSGEHEYQWRTGWDRSFGDALRITPSVQLSSHEFVGGSLQAETG